jgi:hypothetical protein
MLPSAFLYSVGTLDGNFSRLNNTLPACSPVNASSTSLRMPTHDSGSSCFPYTRRAPKRMLLGVPDQSRPPAKQVPIGQMRPRG